MVEGIWATPRAKEMFTPIEMAIEMAYAVDDYEEHGPQHFAAGAGFAVYEFDGGRSLVLADKKGKVSLMTAEEVEEEQRGMGLQP
jgi:hypothetical protein